MTMEELNQLAEKGNSNAQYDLGNKHYIGMLGFDQDIDKTIFWWKKAAENDNAEAQFGIGMLLYTGEGIQRDRNEAIFWWKKAANKDHLIAKKYLKYPPHI